MKWSRKQRELQRNHFVDRREAMEVVEAIVVAVVRIALSLAKWIFPAAVAQPMVVECPISDRWEA